MKPWAVAQPIKTRVVVTKTHSHLYPSTANHQVVSSISGFAKAPVDMWLHAVQSLCTGTGVRSCNQPCR